MRTIAAPWRVIGLVSPMTATAQLMRTIAEPLSVIGLVSPG
jgi:hypothetical protein